MKLSELKFEPTANIHLVERAIFTSIWGKSACFRIKTPFSNQGVPSFHINYEIIGDYGNIPPRFANVHYKNLTEVGVQTILDHCWRPEGWAPDAPAPTAEEVALISNEPT